MKTLVISLILLESFLLVSIASAGGSLSGSRGGITPVPLATMPIVGPTELRKSNSEILDDFIIKSKINFYDIKVIKRIGDLSEFKFKGALTGIIIIYDQETELSKEHQQVLNLNTSGHMYNWVLRNKRILLVLPPELTHDEQLSFESILDTLGE